MQRKAFAVLIALAGLVLAGCSGFSSEGTTPTTAPAAVASSAPTMTTAAPTPSPSPSPDGLEGVELVPGSKTTYRCETGYEAVQVPLGESVPIKGARFELKETARNDWGQVSVRFTVTLPAGKTAPALIVNTGDHNLYPKLYPQHTLQINLGSGGNGNYSLPTEVYSPTWWHIGIIDITVCMK